jgi:hypothetical protein
MRRTAPTRSPPLVYVGYERWNNIPPGPTLAARGISTNEHIRPFLPISAGLPFSGVNLLRVLREAERGFRRTFGSVAAGENAGQSRQGADELALGDF